MGIPKKIPSKAVDPRRRAVLGDRAAEEVGRRRPADIRADAAANPETAIDLTQLGVIILIALALRLVLLTTSKFGIESDEAIVGLMAKHIVEGRPWPVFYYGQYYMGSVEALLVAASFALFGRSNAALCLVPLLFSLLHVALVYALARRFVAKGPAKAAALLAAVGPHALVVWGTKARGGFIELVVLGTLALILAVDSVRARRLGVRLPIALGIVLGLGWWMNNQIVFYMAPIGLYCGYHWVRGAGFKAGISSGLVCLAAFFIGGLPFWWANLAAEPPWPSFEVLFGGTEGKGFTAHLNGFFRDALPIIFGSRRFWTNGDVMPFATVIGYLLYGLFFVAALLQLVPRRAQEENSSERNRGIGLLLLFCLATCLIFSASSFGWLSRAPRYLLPLYSVLFLLPAIVIDRVLAAAESLPATAAARKQRLFGRALCCSLVAVLLSLQLVSNFRGGIEPGQPVIFQGQRVARDHSALYAWLAASGYRHIFTNYWIGYRTAFETDEAITFTRFGRPRSLRIPAYEAPENADAHPPVYVLTPAEVPPFARQLWQMGFAFRQLAVGPYIVIDHIMRAHPLGEPLDIDPELVTATVNGESSPRMFDDDLITRWGSGTAQQPGMEIEIRLPEPAAISGVVIDLGDFIHDAPRGLVVEGIDERGVAAILADFRGTKISQDLQDQEFAEIPRIWEISFAARRVNTLRLRQLGSDPVFDWSVAELKVYAVAVE